MRTNVTPPTDSAKLPPLRTIRTSQALTLRETARRAQIDPAHLSRVERGEAKLSLDALARVARVLSIRPFADMLDQYLRPKENGKPIP